MKYPHSRVIIMSKAPEPGAVKTRLIPLLGRDGAARCYRTMLLDMLKRLAVAPPCPLELCCAPDSHHAFFAEAGRDHALQLTNQCGSDLGERMSNALVTALRQADRAVLIGADCPGLSVSDIETALRLLGQGIDVVLGPASDGGYYLIGLRAHQPRLFEAIPWGSDRVLAETRQRLENLKLSCQLLDVRTDIDTPSDYLAWQDSAGGPGRHDPERQVNSTTSVQ